MFTALLFTTLLAGLAYYLFVYKSTKTAPKPAKQEPKPDTSKKGKSTRKESALSNTSNNSDPPSTGPASGPGDSSFKNLKKQEAELKKNQKKIKKTNPTHASFLRGFKGFRERVADFDVSSDGSYVVACSSDSTVRVYRPKNLEDLDPLCVFQKIDYYEPSTVSIRQDCKVVAVGTGDAKMVEFFTVEEVRVPDEDKVKLKIESLSKTPASLQKTTLTHLFLDPNGKFIVTGSDEEDTTLRVWNTGGDSLASFDTAQLKNHHVIRSEDGRFLAVGAWTSDVMILELKSNKDGSFKSFAKAMTLKGHRQGIMDLALNPTTDKAVTISKDKTMKLWNINVRYEVAEDPKCLATVNIAEHEELKDISPQVRIALHTYESGRSVAAISIGSNIALFDFEKNKVIDTIVNAHSEGSRIYKLVFKVHRENPYLYSSGDDGRVNQWSFKDM